ncbi:hypothetical protein ACOSP7_001276 [Xanthoceras sorbifolium]
MAEPGRWSEELVRQYFVPKEADLVLSLPLSSFSRPDYFLWHYDRKGEFSVKSAYKLALNDNGNLSSFSGPSPWWKKLWGLNLPSKIKILCWKASKGILSTKTLLWKRGIFPSYFCDCCGLEPESIDHALWGCSKVLSR